MASVGELISESFLSKSLAAGLVITRVSSFIDGFPVVWNPDITEIGGGAYRYAFTATVEGPHEWVGIGTNGERFAINVEVEPIPEPEPPPSVVGAITEGAPLHEIRLAIGTRIRDALVLRATAGGSEELIVDTTNLLDANDAYVSSWGVVISGSAANEGHVFRVIDSSQVNGTITIAPPMAEPLAVGDVVNLFNLMGKGFRPQTYDREIAELVNESYPDFLVYATAAITAPYDCFSRRIAVPEPITYVYELQYERSEDDWVNVGPQYWTADLARHEVVIKRESMSGRLHGETLRVAGMGRHPAVLEDSDLIAIDREYLVIAGAARMAAKRSTMREWTDNAARWERQAEQLRGDRSTVLPNNAQRVR